jgi:hypothetical protein
MTGEGFTTGVFLGDKVGDNDCIMQIAPKCSNIPCFLLHYIRNISLHASCPSAIFTLLLVAACKSKLPCYDAGGRFCNCNRVLVWIGT